MKNPAHPCACGCHCTAHRQPPASCFASYFHFDQGVISFSLKRTTILLSSVFSLTLLVQLLQTCPAGTFECSIHDFPMISTVIRQEMYDRIFILETSIFMFAVQTANLRAFYKKLYGVIGAAENDAMFYCGLVSCVALVLIGIFDEKMWSPQHNVIAMTFFLSFAGYAISLGRALYANRGSYPASEGKHIDKLYRDTFWLGGGLAVLLACLYCFKSDTPTPFIEWILVMWYLNFFSLTGLANDFYQTVHEPQK